MKDKQLTIALLLILASLSLNLRAQNKVKEIKLTNISGKAIGGNMESLQQVKERAINEAKISALKQAGIEENISSFTDYFQSEHDNKLEELFTTDILSDIRGAVKNVDVIETKKYFNDFDKLVVEVRINCTVVKYLSERDLTFDVWVDGIGKFYTDNSKLVFKVKSSKDCYANMFIFNQDEAYKLFPNGLEESFLLAQKTEYVFPTYKADYYLETKKDSEAHRMIMVFTKMEIPYTGKIKYKDIIDWIFSIPPDMRVIKSFGFTVVQEEKMGE
ncbi:MAG: DUF4384 domain-containing protein [Bacteroidetes bacterium]|nr:DUF4384 domain-containing protein [Bacteroidota bacterium]